MTRRLPLFEALSAWPASRPTGIRFARRSNDGFLCPVRQRNIRSRRVGAGPHTDTAAGSVHGIRQGQWIGEILRRGTVHE